MKKLVLLTAVMLIAAQFAVAGPFGLEKGMTLGEVTSVCGGKKPKQVAEDCYIIEPQNRHEEFDTYIAWIDKDEGLNYLKAVGESIMCNDNGTQIRNRFADMHKRLNSRYGEGELVDRARNSLWGLSDDTHWMYTLKTGDRVLASFWYDNLPEGLAGVALVTEADEFMYKKARLCLEYEFSNYVKVQRKNDEML